MSLFVQQHKGTIRRIRGTIGGCKAWKQHEDDGNCGRTNPAQRRRLIEQIQDNLALEQLDEDLTYEPKPRHGNKRTDNRTHRVNSRPHRLQSVQPVAPAPVVQAKVEPRPRFKIVISASGTMVAEPVI